MNRLSRKGGPIEQPAFVRPNLNAPLPTVTPQGSDYEADTRTILILNGGGSERVFSTSRRWSGLDVTVQVPSLPAGVTSFSSAQVGIYAINGKVRALVATGILSFDSLDNVARRIARVRGVIAERFEVVFRYDATVVAGTVPPPVYLSYVASNETSDASDDDAIGTVALSAMIDGILDGGLGNIPVVWAPATELGFQLMGLHALGVAAAPSFLQVFDTATIAGAIGTAPIWSFPLGANASLFEWSPMLRYKRFESGVLVAVSTTPGALALGVRGDAWMNVWLR